MGINLLNYKNILIITPNLSLNGANTVLLELIKLLTQKGCKLSILASEDGELKSKFSDQGVDCIIKPTVLGGDDVFEQFDAVFLNTSSVHFYALKFQNTDMPVIWWFHESLEQLGREKENFVHLALLSKNFTFAGVTPKVVNGLKTLYGISAELLPMPVEDCYKADGGNECGLMSADDDEIASNEMCIFFIPGAYTYIKGQDVLLNAISKLPPEFMEKSEFIFAGYSLPGQTEYRDGIIKLAEHFSNVKMLDSISREKVYEQYQKCDCVIAPSRIDSTPTTIVEAMMYKKLCIVSSGAGISDLMHDCIDGFVFPNENVDELFKRLLLVISERENLSGLALAGRNIYESLFSPEAVMNRLGANL